MKGEGSDSVDNEKEYFIDAQKVNEVMNGEGSGSGSKVAGEMNTSPAPPVQSLPAAAAEDGTMRDSANIESVGISISPDPALEMSVRSHAESVDGVDEGEEETDLADGEGRALNCFEV